MATKKLTLSDFLAPTISDQPTKLYITLDGKETKEHLLVISAAHSDLKRPLFHYGMQINKLKSECNAIKDEEEKLFSYSCGEIEVDKELASKMVVGWSLGDFSAELLDSLLDNNQTLVKGIYARSFDTSKYTKKK